MKKYLLLTLAALACGAPCRPAGAAAAPYFPYDTINDYYKTPPAPEAGQAPAPAPAPAPPAQRPALRPERPGQPPALGRAPEFLFPPQLGFGVAVGVPYDMVYLSKTFYLWYAGVWQRSASYRGPWTQLSAGQLPPELQKFRLAKIRALRNKEFRVYWKDRERYQGKRFVPNGGNDLPAASKGTLPAGGQ
jgi:hypothetical protein